jgi:hypothetical protein
MSKKKEMQFGKGVYITAKGWKAVVGQVRSARQGGWWLQGAIEVPENPGVLFFHQWGLDGESTIGQASARLLRPWDEELDGF